MKKFLAFVPLIFIFFYLRIPQILAKTIPYTYDQGRDFLRVAAFIDKFDIPFIGPTTGIIGLNHGVWWYYALAIPYAFTGGNPLGFYFFTTLVFFLVSVLFAYFLYKRFNFSAALFFFLLVTFSPRLIFLSNFPVNSTFTMPFVLLLIWSSFEFFRTKKLIFELLIFFSLAMIFETEVPFGMFLIPSYVVAIFLLKKREIFFRKVQNIRYALFGFLVAFFPRMLYEVKNLFPELRTIIRLFTHPQEAATKTFQQALFDRFNYFFGHYKQAYVDQLQLIGVFFLIFILCLFLYFRKRIESETRNTLYLLCLSIGGVFLLSLFYRASFWDNYLEGLALMFMALLAMMVGRFIELKNKPLTLFLTTLIVLFYAVNVGILTLPKQEGPQEGMIEQLNSAQYVYDRIGNKKGCVRVYTPPVIPHTFDYLFFYLSKHNEGFATTADYVNDECYYIIERDDYQFRVDKFRLEHIPKMAKMVEKKAISKNVSVELWRL